MKQMKSLTPQQGEKEIGKLVKREIASNEARARAGQREATRLMRKPPASVKGSPRGGKW